MISRLSTSVFVLLLISYVTWSAGEATAQQSNVASKSWGQLLSNDQRVSAFYYVWYGNPDTDGGEYKHWNHEILPHWNTKEREQWQHGTRFDPPGNVHAPYYPLKGPYSSSDPGTIRQHIQEMLACNVTILVISWWGPSWREGTHDTQGVNTDAVLGLVVHELEQQDSLKLAFHMEPYEGRTVETVRDDLQHLMEQYGSSPALLRIDGRPVYYMYDSYRIPADAWAKLLTPDGELTVRGTHLDGVFIALMLTLHDGPDIIEGGFDGCYTYFASEQVSWAAQPANWLTIARWAEEHHKLFIASVGPGYDDSRIRPWNAGATRPRQDGDRYREHWAAAAGSGAHGVSITSWNEWGEGTQVEPSQPWRDPSTGAAYKDYGEGGPWLYLNITQQQALRFIQAWHDKQQATEHIQAVSLGDDGSNVVHVLKSDAEVMVEVEDEEADMGAADPAQQESLQADASNRVEL